MNPSVPSSSHAQPSHGIELFSLYVYPAGVCSLPHSPQERRGVRKVENSRVAFRRSFRFGASQLVGEFVWRPSSNRSTVKGCDPGSTLGHAHPHGGASTFSASFNGCRGEPFLRACRRHCWLPAVHVLAVCLVCMLIAVSSLMLSVVCACAQPQCMCVLPRSPGRCRGG